MLDVLTAENQQLRSNGDLLSIPLEKLMEGEYFGSLTDSDLQGIFDVLKTTETLTNKEKKRFGII